MAVYSANRLLSASERLNGIIAVLAAVLTSRSSPVWVFLIFSVTMIDACLWPIMLHSDLEQFGEGVLRVRV